MEYYVKFDVKEPCLHISRNKVTFSFRRTENMEIPKGTTLREIATNPRVRIGVNRVGGEIIEKMYEPSTISEMVTYFSSRYNEDPEIVKKNIMNFLSDFQHKLGINIVQCSKEEMLKSCFRKTGNWEFNIPEGIVLELSYKCNYRCRHCYNNSSSNFPTYMDIEFIESLLDEIESLGVKVIELTGGEPTIYPYFKDVLKSIFLHNFDLVGILSNGSGFTEETYKLLKEFKDKVAVQIDLHGASPSYVEWFTGNKAAFNKAIEAISQIASLGIPVRVACNVTPKNVDQMFDVAKIAKNLGAASVAFGPVAPLGRARENKDIVLSLDLNAFEKFRKNIDDLLKIYGKDFIATLENIPNRINCGAGWNNLTISPTLDVKICQMAGSVIDNLNNYQQSYKEFLLHNSELLESISDTPAPNEKICGSCENLWFCYGCMTRGLMMAREIGGECKWRKFLEQERPLVSEKFLRA